MSYCAVYNTLELVFQNDCWLSLKKKVYETIHWETFDDLKKKVFGKGIFVYLYIQQNSLKSDGTAFAHLFYRSVSTNMLVRQSQVQRLGSTFHTFSIDTLGSSSLQIPNVQRFLENYLYAIVLYLNLHANTSTIFFTESLTIRIKPFGYQNLAKLAN